MNFRLAYVLGVSLAAATIQACSPSNSCEADFDCDTGKICQNGACVKGSHVGDLDHVQDGDSDIDLPVGDSDITPGDGPDTTGPLLILVAPAPYQLVHGEVAVVVQASDPSGVDPATVMAHFAEQWTVTLTSQDDSNTLFLAKYDTSVHLTHLSFVPLVITAYDRVGNQTEIGSEIALDYQPPVIALQSRLMVGKRDAPGDKFECSVEFDPLGDWSLKHGQTIPGVEPDYHDAGMGFYARVRMQDLAATPSVDVSHWVSGIDPSTPEVYFLDQSGIDVGQPLVIGGGLGTTCTHINPAVLPDSLNPSQNQAIVQRLVPIPSAGQPNFSGGPSVMPPECDLAGSSEEPPLRLCRYSDEQLFMWVPTCPGSGAPAIWVVADYDPQSIPICGGGPMDALNFSADGYVCVAAAAADNFGQWGVSMPIVVCVDRDGSGNCAGFTPALADSIRDTLCTDGCTVLDYGTPADPFEVFYFQGE